MLKLTYVNEDGDELVVELPSRMEVCGECDGHGHVLCEGMRGYAYSAEEFEESFDEDERAEYFRHGGRYDVSCPECHGKNVVPVVDVDKLTDEQRSQWVEAECYAAQCARWDAEDRATMRAECGWRD